MIEQSPVEDNYGPSPLLKIREMLDRWEVIERVQYNIRLKGLDLVDGFNRLRASAICERSKCP